MLSLNQLSTSLNQLQTSKNSNSCMNWDNSLNKKGNNQNLFKKCKIVIQQQMTQIKQLMRQNQELKNEIQQKQKCNQQMKHEMNLINKNFQQVIEKNQSLHKQINKLTQTLELQNIRIYEKDNQIKLLQNKVQLITNKMHQFQQQKQNYRVKSNILQQNMQLLSIQNNQIKKILHQRDNQVYQEVQNLKKVNLNLKRRNKIQDLDARLSCNKQRKLIYDGQEHQHLYRNSNNEENDEKFKRYQHINPLKMSMTICKPFSIVKQDPFNNIHISRCKQSQIYKFDDSSCLKTSHSTQIKKGNLKKHDKEVKQFSILDRKLNTISPPYSRIRKNYGNRNMQSKQLNKSRLIACQMKNNPQNTQLTEKNRKLQHKRVDLVNKTQQNDINTVSSPKKYCQVQKTSQMQRQVSQIKRQIKSLYGKTQIKKQRLNQQRISHTLQQIQKKLSRMAQISSFEDSQSQLS